MIEYNWVNIFFMMLVISLIIFTICWFFNIHIPNLNRIKSDIKKVEIPTTYKTEEDCEEIVYDWIDNNEEECRSICSSKSSFNGKGMESILITYKSYSCDKDNKLICECNK